MNKCIKYPEIGQFRNVVYAINQAATYIGRDEKDEPVFNSLAPKPTIKFKGTVKLHGTNAAVCWNSKDGFWIQSRTAVIKVGDDNYGFAAFVEERRKPFLELLDLVRDSLGVDTNLFTISIYGEWAGKGIQKAVGISQLEKAFYVFGVKISSISDETIPSYWVTSSYVKDPTNQIHNVEDFETYDIEIDFNNPQLSQNILGEITKAVEKECPTSKARGVIGIGEGVVWSGTYRDKIYRFKVKGEKHSSSKVKTLAKVDIEKLNSINEFAEYAVTESRFNQAVENTFGGEEINMMGLGNLIRWVTSDVMKEESDTLAENKLTMKDVGKAVSTRARTMFFELYNKL